MAKRKAISVFRGILHWLLRFVDFGISLNGESLNIEIFLGGYMVFERTILLVKGTDGGMYKYERYV